MILWQKQASAKWLAAHEARLEELAGSNLAIITRPGRARSVAQVVCRRRRQAENLRRRFGGTIQLQPRNWLLSRPHRPIRIGQRLEVVSEPKDVNAGRAQLIIPAAGAFGTGEHATTAMSLRLLEKATRNLPSGWRLLDAGTGTGILALAARRLGAAEVLGLDNDSRAVARARENARRNRVTRAKFVTGDILRFNTGGYFDLVTANLFSELLIAALPVFRRTLASGGALIVSGILREQAPAVIGALARVGFYLEKECRRGKWIALFATRKSQLKRRERQLPSSRPSDFDCLQNRGCIRQAAQDSLCRLKNFPTSSSLPTRCANRAPAAFFPDSFPVPDSTLSAAGCSPRAKSSSGVTPRGS